MNIRSLLKWPLLALGALLIGAPAYGQTPVQNLFGVTTSGGAKGFQPVDQTHGLPVNVISGGGTGGTSSTFGAAFPATGTAVGMTDGTNMVPFKGDTTNGLWVNVKTGGGGSSTFDAAFPATGIAIGLNDGTNLKSWQAAIALGDGVNGNNTAAVAGWLWNGTNYDRATGTAALGQYTQSKINSIADGANITLGAKADAACGTATGTCTTQALFKFLNNAAIAPAPVKAGTLPSTQTPVSTGTTTAAQSDLNGNLYVNPISGYPAGAVPITASATGTTGATTATLAASASLKTYICSYSVRANATAVTTVLNTVTGVVTATLSHQMWVPANTAGLGVDEQIFTPCVPGSATNTAIAVVSGAPGTGGVVSVTATGYQAP